MRTSAEIEAEKLCNLTQSEIAHVSLGLGHAFGCVFVGVESEAVMYLRDEYGSYTALDARTLTGADLWRKAETLSA